MTIYFTADTHIGHTNIIKYCNRPFATTKEHDETIIENWNALVGRTDPIYHLGDFAMPKAGECGQLPREYALDVLGRLNGVKYFIRGNHDKLITGRVKERFQFDKLYHELNVDDEEMDIRQCIVLFHYAIESWNKRIHGSWHLHGHSHGTLYTPDDMARLDVGVDCHDFCPISYEQVKEILTRRIYGR